MRCTVFDKDEIKWLERIGFTVAEDQESASFLHRDAKVDIILPYRGEFFMVMELPNGFELRSFLSRGQLERAADLDPEADEEEMAEEN